MTATASADRPARRSEGDVDAMVAAYRSGNVFLGELSMPIIDFRHYLEPELNMHHSLQSFTTRLRMLRWQGHADNQVIWFADLPYSPLGDAIELLERWLENMRADASLSVVDARPININMIKIVSAPSGSLSRGSICNPAVVLAETE